MSIVKVFEVSGHGPEYVEKSQVRIIAVDFGDAEKKYREFVKSDERWNFPRASTEEWPKDPIRISFVGSVVV